jgi:CheY-like chemotaxis protein
VPRTVLVADDSPTIQNKAKGILTGEGLEVVTVSNGVAAIKKLPQVRPQLVLADVSMPGRDGYEVCDFVKSSPELRHIPVVLIFSDVDPYDEEQGGRVHADGRIRKMASGKPFDAEELIAMVSGFLAQAEANTPSAAGEAETATAVASGRVTEPVDLEPQPQTKKTFDLGTLPRGVAFADAEGEGAAATPEFPPAPDATTETLLETAPPRPDEEGSGGREPVLVEEPTAPPEPPSPSAERTVMFRTPAEIAEPMLNDELAVPPPPAEPESPSAPATSLDSFSLHEATTGEVRFASAQSETAHETATPPPEPPTGTTISFPAPVDTNLVHTIVQKVVARMSPPALSQEVIEEMSRKLAGEIIAELIAES